MKSDYMGRRLGGHVTGDLETPITALDAVLGVSQAIHQHDKGLGHARRVPAPSCCWSHESKSRQGRYDNIKCRRIAVAGLRQWADHRRKLENRAGPSVDQQQRHGVRTGGAFMDEINLLPVNFCGVLVETIDSRLLCAPVVLLLPVVR